MNINPFIDLISQIISLTEMSIIIYISMSWLVQFNILNANQSFVSKVLEFFSKLLEPLFSQVRKYVPLVGGIDLSPLVLILLLNFLKSFLFHYFYQF